MIRDRLSGSEEVTNLRLDPGERDNYIGHYAEMDEFLRRRLKEYERMGGFLPFLRRSRKAELSEKQREGLKSLGYLQ